MDNKISKKRTLMFCNILSLCYLYTLIALCFAFVYMILDILDIGSIYNNNDTGTTQFFDIIIDYVYFSFVTLTAVGFGDFVPLGTAKIFAFAEALLGYVLPYAIILNYVAYSPRFIKYFSKK